MLKTIEEFLKEDLDQHLDGIKFKEDKYNEHFYQKSLYECDEEIFKNIYDFVVFEFLKKNFEVEKNYKYFECNEKYFCPYFRVNGKYVSILSSYEKKEVEKVDFFRSHNVYCFSDKQCQKIKEQMIKEKGIDFFQSHRLLGGKTYVDEIPEHLKSNDFVSFICAECHNRTTIHSFNFDRIFLCESCKRQKTNLKKYGSTSPFSCEEIRQKAKSTILQRYGVVNSYQIEKIRSKSRKAHPHYRYDGKIFDSSWELAYYIWLKDQNIEFVYQPNISFSYSVGNKEHLYFPDFLVQDKIIEIKGDHFLNGDVLKNPYNGSVQNEKLKCMIENKVTILKWNEIRKYVFYVRKKNGNGFFRSCLI